MDMESNFEYKLRIYQQNHQKIMKASGNTASAERAGESTRTTDFQLDEKLAQARQITTLQLLQQVQQQAEKRLLGLANAHDVKDGVDGSQGTGVSPIDDANQFILGRPLELLDMYIDAKDTLNKWCIAKIVDHDMVSGKLTLHFDGWSARYDQIVNITSQRIAPLRRFSKGYTGQVTIAHREFDLNYAYQVDLVNRIQRIIDTNFQCFHDPQECTQFLRAELYIYFDSVTTLISDPQVQDLQVMFDFTAAVFKLVLKWLELFPTHLVRYYRLGLQHPMLYCVDLQVAIASCGFELLDMLNTCLANSDRANRFFLKHTKFPPYDCPLVQQSMAANPKPPSLILLSMAGKFKELDGFDRLLQVLENQGDYKVPIQVMSLILKTMQTTPDLGTTKEFRAELHDGLRDRVLRRLSNENLSSADIKETQLDEFRLLLRRLARFLRQPADEVDLVEVWMLKIALRFLTSPFFEKRIKGMQEFKYFQEQVILRANERPKQRKGDPLPIDLATYAKWITENKLISFIFEENPHSELIKRSSCILRVLADDAGKVPPEIVQLIWSCCSPEKHEDIVRAGFELIVEVAAYLPSGALEAFFSHIRALDVAAFDEKTVTFLKDFSMAAVGNLKQTRKRLDAQQKRTTGGGISGMFGGGRNNSSKKQPADPVYEDHRFYDPQIFWDIAQDANRSANARTKELALTSLIEVLCAAQTIRPDVKQHFVSLALDNVQAGRAVHASITFLQSLLGTYPHEDASTFSSSVYGSMGSTRKRNQRGSQAQTPQANTEVCIETFVSQILKQVDLYQSVITQAATYMRRYKLAEGQIDSAPVMAARGNSANQQHEESIRTFISFVEFIVVNSRAITLKFEHVQEMFRMFVTEAVSEIETRLFFEFLTKENQKAKTRERAYILDEKLRTQVFSEIMCNEASMDCVNLGQLAFDCFHTLFLGVNAQEGNLQLDKEEQKEIRLVKHFDRIKGLKTLWQIATRSKLEAVREKSRDTLCDMYLLAMTANLSQRIKLDESFIRQCHQHLVEVLDGSAPGLPTADNEKNQIVMNCLKLMRTFIRRFDKEHLIRELKATTDNMNQAERRQTKVINVQLDPDGLQARVEINLNTKFWQLMYQMSQLFDMKISEFHILAKHGPIAPAMYNDYMRDYTLNDINMQRLVPERLEKELPSYVIGYDQGCIDVFIQVLRRRDRDVSCEVIGLVEALQISPKLLKMVSDTISKMRPIPQESNSRSTQPDSVGSVAPGDKVDPKDGAINASLASMAISEQDEEKKYNFADWQHLLKWTEQEPNKLHQTYYMLSCLKEVACVKASQAPNKEAGVYGGFQAEIIRWPQQPSEQAQRLEQEKQARFDLSQRMLQRGGFHFLLHMFQSIDKTNVDYERDMLTSKSLQTIMLLLSRCYIQRLQPILQAVQKPNHLTDLIQGLLEITETFLKGVLVRQQAALAEKGACDQASAYQAMQLPGFDIAVLQQTTNFLLKVCTSFPDAFYMNIADDPRLINIVRLGLVELGHKKVQERVAHFCRQLISVVEKNMIDNYYTQRFGNIQTLQSPTGGLGSSSLQTPGRDSQQNEQLNITPQMQSEMLADTEFSCSLPSFLIIRSCIKEFIGSSIREPCTQKLKQLYQLMQAIIASTHAHQMIELIEAPEVVVRNLITLIENREIRESTSREEDVVLAGIFNFLGIVLTRLVRVRQGLTDKLKLIEFLTHHGLFKKEKRSELLPLDQAANAPNLPPMCKNPNTRSSCLELLRILCLDELPDKLFITQYLKKNVCSETFWRTPRRNDWTVAVNQQERSVSGFVGLKNPGCTCYMNSIMQQLYMIPNFRRLVLEVEAPTQEECEEVKQEASVNAQPEEEDVLFQVKCIFAGLMEGEKQYYNPKKFLKAFKDFDGSPIDVYVQKDVDEFFNMFMDRLEALIKGTQAEKLMTNMFQGVFANEFICKDCPHYSEREEPFLAISLQVKNKSSLQDSLAYYVEGEMLEGDNAYFCEACDKKINTLKRCCIKRMPNTLFAVLKRIDFDYETLQRDKINDYCEFPMELDMRPYSQQEMARQDLLAKMEEKGRAVDDLNEDELLVLNRQVPDNYYKYTLKGIICHYGTADQGHYYSFIKDREREARTGESRWFEFNDTIVRDFDPAEIPDECYGGEDQNLESNILEMQQANNGKVDVNMINAMRQFKNKMKNAYVLIYDRIAQYDMKKVNIVMDDAATANLSQKEQAKLYGNCKFQVAPQGQAPLTQPTALLQMLASRLPPQIPHRVQDVILAKNKKFWLNKTIFSADFINKILRIFLDIKVKEDQDYRKYASPDFDLQKSGTNDQFEAYKFVITFFLTVALRSKERSVLVDYLKLIRDALKKNIGLCLWLLETFTSQDFIKEFLVDCPIHDLVRFTQGLLKTAMEQVYENEKDVIAQYLSSYNTKEGPLVCAKELMHAQLDEELVVDGTQTTSIETPDGAEIGVLTGCQLTTIYRLKNLDCRKFPKLLAFINSFIHMSTSSHLHRQYRMSGQFWTTFADFAMLGTYARLYLLQTRCLGRLLDMFLTQSRDSFFQPSDLVNYNEKFRNNSLRQVPLIVYSKPFYIGMDPERSRIELSAAERKQLGALITSTTTYLLLAISILARSCCLVKPNKGSGASLSSPSQPPASYNFALDQSLGNDRYVPDREELELLLQHQHPKWWHLEAQPKLARNAVAMLFAYICTDNDSATAAYITTLMQLITQTATISVRRLERPLLRLVQIGDKYQADRIKRIIQKLSELFKGSRSCYLQCDSLIEMVLKLSLRSPTFAQILYKNHSELVKQFEKFTKENPSLPITSQKVRLFKEGQVSWNELKQNFLTKQKLEWIKTYNTRRIERLVTHLKRKEPEQRRVAELAAINDLHLMDPSTKHMRPNQQQVQMYAEQMQQLSQEDLFDTDDELYSRKLAVDQLVDYRINEEWRLGIVVTSLDEMVRCKAHSKNAKQAHLQWLPLDSDNLAPAHAHTENDREHLHKFYFDLSAYVIPAQQQQR